MAFVDVDTLSSLIPGNSNQNVRLTSIIKRMDYIGLSQVEIKSHEILRPEYSTSGVPKPKVFWRSYHMA